MWLGVVYWGCQRQALLLDVCLHPCLYPVITPSSAPPLPAPLPPPQVPDVNAPGFWDRMDRMVGYNLQLVAIEKSNAPGLLKTLQKLPLLERIAANVFQLFLMPTKRCGSLDIEGASQYQY